MPLDQTTTVNNLRRKLLAKLLTELPPRLEEPTTRRKERRKSRTRRNTPSLRNLLPQRRLRKARLPLLKLSLNVNNNLPLLVPTCLNLTTLLPLPLQLLPPPLPASATLKYLLPKAAQPTLPLPQLPQHPRLPIPNLRKKLLPPPLLSNLNNPKLKLNSHRKERFPLNRFNLLASLTTDSLTHQQDSEETVEVAEV